MPDLIFNRPTDNYVFTGSKVRAGDTSTKLTLASTSAQSVIDLCNNSNIDISASTVFVNGQIVSEGGIQIGSGLYGGKIYKTATNPYEIIIDPFAMDACGNTQDASGQVTIMGDLIVRGSTTTVYSTNVDISDVVLTLALGSTNALKSDGGIRLGDGYASLLYTSEGDKWNSNINMEVSGNLNIKGNLSVASAVTNSSKITANAGIDFSTNVLPLNNASQLPVTMSTFALKTTGLLSGIGDTSANDWVDAPGYIISKVVLSANSYIKMEFKVNYTSSPEADQTLSFQVLKSITGSTGTYTSVFSDISLGSNMGVTFNNVYYGTFIDDLSGATFSPALTVFYKLQFRRDCPSYDTISTPFGIQVSSGNYISLQELYERNA